MRSTPVLRLTALVVAALAVAGGLAGCESGDEPESSTKAVDTTGESTGSADPAETGTTGTTGSADPSGTSGGQTTILGTGCELAPATTTIGERSGGHIVCPGADDGQRPPFPPDTAVPSPEEGGGVISGALTEDGTGAALPGVVVIPELNISVASGADGRFGVAVEPGTYHLSAVVNRDVSYICSTPTVEVTEGNAVDGVMTCHH